MINSRVLSNKRYAALGKAYDHQWYEEESPEEFESLDSLDENFWSDDTEHPIYGSRLG